MSSRRFEMFEIRQILVRCAKEIQTGFWPKSESSAVEKSLRFAAWPKPMAGWTGLSRCQTMPHWIGLNMGLSTHTRWEKLPQTQTYPKFT